MSDRAFRDGVRLVLGDPVLLREWLGTLSRPEFYALNEAADEESQRRVADALLAPLGRVAEKAPDMARALLELGHTVGKLGQVLRTVDRRMTAAAQHASGVHRRMRWPSARTAPPGALSVAPGYASVFSAPSAAYSAALSVWPPPERGPDFSAAPVSDADAASAAVAEAIESRPRWRLVDVGGMRIVEDFVDSDEVAECSSCGSVVTAYGNPSVCSHWHGENVPRTDRTRCPGSNRPPVAGSRRPR